MKKIFYVCCICLMAFSFTACNQDRSTKNTFEKTPNIKIPNNNTVADDNHVPPVAKTSEDNSKKLNQSGPYYNEELQQYEDVNFSDEFLEIMGEKIKFNGKGYQDISSLLHERVMFNAVRFYMAAAASDIDTLKKMADTELLSEIEKSISKTGDNSFKLGGNVVTSFKDLSLYNKPISITAPKQINGNEYKITMEYSNKNKRHFVDVILISQSNEVKIKSFIIKP